MHRINNGTSVAMADVKRRYVMSAAYSSGQLLEFQMNSVNTITRTEEYHFM